MDIRLFRARRCLSSAFACIAIAVCHLCMPISSGARAADEQAPASATKVAVEESWQVVYIGKARVGYGRTTIETRQREGRELIVSDTEMSLVMTRFGQTVRTKTQMQSVETADGDLVSFRFELLNPPAAPTVRTGRVESGRLIVEAQVAGKTTRSETPWDGTLKAPGYQDRQLRENPLKPGQKRTIQTFDPQFSKASVVTMQAGKEEDVELLGGGRQKLLKVSIATSIAPGILLDEFLDSQGEALVTRMSLLGMATYKVSKAEALKSISGEEVDLAVSTLVKVAKIDRPQQTARVRYRLTTPGDDPARLLSIGPTQQITATGNDTVELLVTSIQPPPTADPGARPAGEEYLASNDYLQSDNDLVKAHAAEAAGTATDPWEVSRRLEKWVHGHLKRKNFSTLLASAAEVAKDLQGDCTEHAVLLSAMARARNIPSRVAVGIVYVDSLQSFGGHMWSEVYINGVWVPLDATLGQGGIAADHIKFADSSFSEDDAAAPIATFLPLVSILGKLQIEVIDVKYR